MKTVDTLIEDIEDVVRDGVNPSALDPNRLAALGLSMSESVRQALDQSDRAKSPLLRMSNIGTPCNRKLWYSVNEPEKAERLSSSARLKFLFGHLIEELILYLAELSGHKVEGRQDELEIEGVKGHRDAIIDGTTIDAKSASTYSFKKFKEHGLSEDDPFGYLDQIESYRRAGEADDRTTDKERCGFLVVDKTLGNICLDLYGKKSFPIEKVIKYKKDVVSRPEPPARGFDPVPEGKSGNMKLPVNCAYCDFKNHCHPGLRTFLYARGPVFLTTVRKEPDVKEVSNNSDLEELVSD